MRPSRLVTVGDRSFGSVGPKLWNSLPDDITSASSLSVFRKETENSLISSILSGHYFVVCYGFFVATVVLEVNCYLGHVIKCNVM